MVCRNYIIIVCCKYIIIAYRKYIVIVYLKYISSVSGRYGPIDPYVKPFFPPDPPEITTLTPALIDNEEIQTE